ncbi:MAG: hypothetical protein WA949_04860 [Phormidesmis sp.]
MSTSVLPQLLEVDSELSAQATALEAQLIELQEKRKGIQTVIFMFESGEAPAAADVSAVAAAPTTTKTATKKTAVGAKATGKRKAAKSTAAKSTAAESTAAKSTAAKSTVAKSTVAKSAKSTVTKSTKPKVTRGRPSKVKKAATAVAETKTKTVSEAEQKIAASKRSGRTADWQRYLQGTHKKSPLPDVIVGVLQAQPDNIFKIADVMNVVFKEDMPKSHFLKARNRISNILSAGARDGVWYRGRGGTYSMSEKAIKAS